MKKVYIAASAEPFEKKLSIEEMQKIVNHCEDTVSRIHRKEGSGADV